MKSNVQSITRRSIKTMIAQLVKKYEKKRAKCYREARKATKRNDFEGQLIFAAYQMAYTEMQIDLEQFLKRSAK